MGVDLELDLLWSPSLTLFQLFWIWFSPTLTQGLDFKALGSSLCISCIWFSTLIWQLHCDECSWDQHDKPLKYMHLLFSHSEYFVKVLPKLALPRVWYILAYRKFAMAIIQGFLVNTLRALEPLFQFLGKSPTLPASVPVIEFRPGPARVFAYLSGLPISWTKSSCQTTSYILQ